MEKVIELLWRWIVLAESALLDRLTEPMASLRQAESAVTALQEAEKRARALAELEGALRTLGLMVPTVDQLREEWDRAEREGRARSPWGESQVTIDKEE